MSAFVNEILIDHLEMSLNEGIDDDQRADILEAIEKLEQGDVVFPGGEWSVMDIHAFVVDHLGYDLNLDDIDLFGKMLKELNKPVRAI